MIAVAAFRQGSVVVLPSTASLLVEHQDLIQAVIGVIARRHRLSADERDEFAGHTHLRLLEDDGAILRKFEGRSSLRTYLVTVINRLFLDYRVAQWGRWRPSAQARRLGPTAILLERLIVRENRSYDEAESLLRTNFRVEEDAKAIAALYAQLPTIARRRQVDDEALHGLVASVADGERQVMEGEHREHADRTLGCLERALAELPAQDRLILQLRFQESLTVATIARTLALDQKPLYRRLDYLLKDLRARLEAEGIAAEDVNQWLGEPSALSPGVDEQAGPLGETQGPSPSVGGKGTRP